MMRVAIWREKAVQLRKKPPPAFPRIRDVFPLLGAVTDDRIFLKSDAFRLL